jgi:type IV secretion system protein VirD4
VVDLLVPAVLPGRVQLGTLAGRLVANPPRRSLLVQAPTGGGKTPRVAVPAVLRHTGPAVVASVKADVLHLTLTHRRDSGPVWVFDPTGAAGMRAARWSPLSSISGYGDALSAAAWLADSSKVESRGLEDQRFWDTLGQKLLAPMLLAAAATGRHIGDVVAWVDYRAEDEVAVILDRVGDPDAIGAWVASCARVDRTKA